MILIFDLDHTLLDIERFKKDKSKIFRLTPEENEIQGNNLFKKRGVGYNPYVHLKFLRDSGHIKTDSDVEKIKAEFQEAMKKSDDYLFPDVEETLAYLKNKGYRLILMTFGDPEMQQPKIDNSRIKKYFEKTICEEKDKTQNDFFKSLANSNEDILIINDRADQSLAMKKALGKKAKIFLVRGPYSENAEHKEKIHDGISELKNIL